VKGFRKSKGLRGKPKRREGVTCYLHDDYGALIIRSNHQSCGNNGSNNFIIGKALNTGYAIILYAFGPAYRETWSYLSRCNLLKRKNDRVLSLRNLILNNIDQKG